MKNAAVVGFGFMGMTHARNIIRHKDLNLAAIVDSNAALFSMESTVKSGNIQTGDFSVRDSGSAVKYTDFDKCLDSEDIDAVIICVHTGLHYEMTMKSLSRNKHVFVEKPFCLDIGQAQEMTDLARRKGRVLMVGQVVRFMKPYIILKKWIDSGEFGNLKFLHLSRFCGVPGWGQWKEGKIAEASGGALFDLVIHDIDFVNYLFGSPDEIRSVTLPGKLSNHDYISAHWNYRTKGIDVRIEGGNIFHSSFPFQAGYMAGFEKASIHYSTSCGDKIRVSDDNEVREVSAGDAGTGYFDEMDYFSECIENNRLPEKCMPESALESIKLCYKHIQ
jgi:predicted dehydrogenase